MKNNFVRICRCALHSVVMHSPNTFLHAAYIICIWYLPCAWACAAHHQTHQTRALCASDRDRVVVLERTSDKRARSRPRTQQHDSVAAAQNFVESPRSVCLCACVVSSVVAYSVHWPHATHTHTNIHTGTDRAMQAMRVCVSLCVLSYRMVRELFIYVLYICTQCRTYTYTYIFRLSTCHRIDYLCLWHVWVCSCVALRRRCRCAFIIHTMCISNVNAFECVCSFINAYFEQAAAANDLAHERNNHVWKKPTQPNT